MPESRAYRRVMAEGAGVDASFMQEEVDRLWSLASGYEMYRECCSTNEAGNAWDEAMGMLVDLVIPTLSKAVSDIEEIYHVSREGAVDSEE